jgi:hypothetical protein
LTKKANQSNGVEGQFTSTNSRKRKRVRIRCAARRWQKLRRHFELKGGANGRTGIDSL